MTVKNGNIYQRLNRVMEKVSYVQKNQKSGGMRYNFVSHDSVVKAVREHLHAEGVYVYPYNIEFHQDGNRSQVVMQVRFQNIDDKEDYIVIPSAGQGIGNDDKGPGKAISYALKYALLKGLMLETGDDPESNQETDIHLSKETEAAKRRIDLELSNLAEEVVDQSMVTAFKNDNKEDYMLIRKSNPGIAKDIEAKLKTLLNRKEV